MTSYYFEVQPVSYIDYLTISNFVSDNMETISLEYEPLYDDGKGVIKLKGTFSAKGEFFEAAALLRTFLR